MGKKIFVSYKYSDANVKTLPMHPFDTTARHYVDEISSLIKQGEDHIYKGEDDGESMSTLQDATIGSKLGDKIFDSTVTIVLISQGMKNPIAQEKDQWIPWEISYSLKEQSREGKNSKTNAMLAVVLPNQFGNYDYFITENACPFCNCRILKTDFLFKILKNNMFNILKPELSTCSNHGERPPYLGYSSYIHTVKWIDFVEDMDKYINIAIDIRRNINQYVVVKAIQ
ncbi:MAG: TIR domain-containing protein [Flavobacteriales bacterium]